MTATVTELHPPLVHLPPCNRGPCGRAMRRALVVAAALGFVIVAGCSSAAADDPNNTSVKIADNGSYGTYLDTHTFDGRTVTCLVARTNQSMTMSCDWSAK